jgi:hypothetical protein
MNVTRPCECGPRDRVADGPRCWRCGGAVVPTPGEIRRLVEGDVAVEARQSLGLLLVLAVGLAFWTAVALVVWRLA